MTQSINVPGIGQLDFPDGMSQPDMAAAIQKNFPQIHAQAQADARSATQEGDPAHAGAAQGQRIATDAADYLNDARNSPGKALLNNAAGPGEAALTIVSGVGSSIVGGLAGLGSIARAGIENQINSGAHIPTSDEFDAALSRAADVSQRVQDAGTYQPRLPMGKLMSEVASVPINAASEGLRAIGGDVGQVVAGDKGRIAGEEIGGIAPAIAATLAGGAALLRRPLAEVAERPPIKTTPAADAAAAQDGAAAVDNSEPVLYRIPKQTEGGGLSQEEQAARAQTLQRIGLTDARLSALSGDSAEGATQAQIAKFTDTSAGQAAKARFDSERTALQDHAADIVADTGGSLGTDNSTLNARGQIIATPFDGLRTYFDDAIKKLYSAADEQSAGRPLTRLDGLGELLGTDSQFAGKAANGSLGNGIKSYLREQNILGKDGELAPVTPQQAESLKQYINSQWSPDTSGLAGKIKSIIDDDVFKGAGGDIYAEARNLFKMQKATLDNPSGVARLMDFDPQTPINRTTPFEKIPDTLTNLPVAQFGHVIDTLNKILDPQYDTPPLLQMQAMDALNEIRGHMANGLLEAGSKYQSKWNASGVTQYLKNNSAKFPMVFTRRAVGKIADLNDAGHILSVDKSYPGAAAQGALAVRRGLMPQIIGKSMAGAGGLAGSFAGPVGATAGAAVGSAAGEGLAATMGGRAALHRFNAGIVNLHEAVAPKPAPVHVAPHPAPPSPAAIAAAAVAQHQHSAAQAAIRSLGTQSTAQILDDATSSAANSMRHFGILAGAAVGI